MIVLKEFEGINRNMRCIEIALHLDADVVTKVINRNMRCIEIDYTDTINEEPLTINRNMRCIEIYVKRPTAVRRVGLIET